MLDLLDLNREAKQTGFPNGVLHKVAPCLLFLLLSPILVPFAAAALVLFAAYRLILNVAVWAFWCTRGRDCLLVYSNSPIWQAHIEQQILPQIRTRATILNWSDRKQWRGTLASAVFHHYGGNREFNPMVVVFRPFRTTKVFRFWQPFQDNKHGKTENLDDLKRDLFKLLSSL